MIDNKNCYMKLRNYLKKVLLPAQRQRKYHENLYGTE